MKGKKKAPLLYSVEAEQAVIGGLMLNQEAWDDVASLVVGKDFYANHHRYIFEEMTRLAMRNESLDLIVLSDTLERKNTLHDVGGFAYLAELSQNTPCATNVVAYAKIVKEYALKRRLSALNQDVSLKLHQQDTSELLNFAEQELFKIAEHYQSSHEERQITDILSDTLTTLEARYKNGGAISGTASGIAVLDDVTCGFQPGDLIIVAGRPSMGKTALSLTLLLGALSQKTSPVIFFSMEMPSPQIMDRMLSSVADVPLHAIRSGNLNEDDWGKLSNAIPVLSEMDNRLIINDSGDLSPAIMRSQIRRYIRKYGKPSLIALDYLQLMRSSTQSENRNHEISEISRSLKAMAKEFQVPMVVLAQLNRTLEHRGDKRPMNSDLRDSGSIEQDADLIIHLYRDEYYNQNSVHKGVLELIIGKNRNGPTGTVKTCFIGEKAKICELKQIDMVDEMEYLL